MQKASVPISKSQRLRKNCGHKKAPKTGLSGAPCWIRTSGLTLRRLNMRFSNKVRNCRYYPVFAYFTGISIMSIMSANVPFNALFPPKC